MSRQPTVADDPIVLRNILQCIDGMQQSLNDQRANATTVAELLAIAEASDWLDGQATPVRRRLDRIESQRFHLARAAHVAQVQA